MSSPRRIYGSNYRPNSKNKAKDRRGSHNFYRGKYKQQWDKTEKNRKRRRMKT